MNPDSGTHGGEVLTSAIKPPVEELPVPLAGADFETVETLRERERMLALLIRHLPGIAYRCRNDPDWSMEFVSEGCLALTGYAASDLIENRRISFGDLVHVDDRDWLWEKCQRSLEKRVPCRNEYRIVTASGDEKWVWDHASGVYDADGELLAVEGLVQDITERKLAEMSLSRAMNELDHRVRNNLAAVIALSNHTIATTTSIEEFASTFTGRIQAMARSHQALAACKTRGMEIGAVARETLAPFSDHQIVIDGEPVALSARAAVPVTLALHELATNALKHGALSSADGRVDVRWSVEAEMLRLRWEESGGPPVSPPGDYGAGIGLITGFVEKELAGAVRSEFRRTGVRHELEIPIDDDHSDD